MRTQIHVGCLGRPWGFGIPYTHPSIISWRPEECRGILGVLILRVLKLTRPLHPVTDFRCPTLTIPLELHARGFRPVTGTVFQKENVIGDMDGREAIRMQAYFIVLLQLDRCLPLTSNIPSDQPILFYKLLLSGQRAEPGLGEA